MKLPHRTGLKGARMDWNRKIARLKREIAKIDEFSYGGDEEGDPELYAGILERKRDDVVRSAVLQLHTAIEDVMASHIMCRVLGLQADTWRSHLNIGPAKALYQMLYGRDSLGFDMKLNFAQAVSIIDAPTRDLLAELNTLRNKCSHNWLLKGSIRRGKRPRQKKPPLLNFRGRDLHRVDVLKDFLGEFGPLYAEMFTKYISLASGE